MTVGGMCLGCPVQQPVGNQEHVCGMEWSEAEKPLVELGSVSSAEPGLRLSPRPSGCNP